MSVWWTGGTGSLCDARVIPLTMSKKGYRIESWIMNYDERYEVIIGANVVYCPLIQGRGSVSR